MDKSKTQQKQETVRLTHRQGKDIPLSPKDTTRCEGCPYPRVGFICWSIDGSCLRTDMDRISRSGR